MTFYITQRLFAVTLEKGSIHIFLSFLLIQTGAVETRGTTYSKDVTCLNVTLIRGMKGL